MNFIENYFQEDSHPEQKISDAVFLWEINDKSKLFLEEKLTETIRMLFIMIFVLFIFFCSSLNNFTKICFSLSFHPQRDKIFSNVFITSQGK